MRRLDSRFPSVAGAAALVACVLLVACASAPIPIPIEGTSQSFGAITGKWIGEYTGSESGRYGSIEFRLDENEIATGDVIMMPGSAARRFGPPTIGPDNVHFEPSFLTISIVRVEGGRVLGTLDPYKDPACDCIVHTTFNGRLVSVNRMEGTFITYGQGLPVPQHGTWFVTRQ